MNYDIILFMQIIIKQLYLWSEKSCYIVIIIYIGNLSSQLPSSSSLGRGPWTKGRRGSTSLGRSGRRRSATWCTLRTTRGSRWPSPVSSTSGSQLPGPSCSCHDACHSSCTMWRWYTACKPLHSATCSTLIPHDRMQPITALAQLFESSLHAAWNSSCTVLYFMNLSYAYLIFISQSFTIHVILGIGTWGGKHIIQYYDWN